jgi:uncharacterized protein (UPF0333 family)
MKLILKRLIAFLAVILLGFGISINEPANAAVSNYQLTCTNIAISGNVLSAYCRRINGSYDQSSLTLLGIENIDGVLEVTSANQVSNYELTCPNIGINGNVLTATCRRRDQSLNTSSLVLNGIENIDGVLKYTSSPL